MPAVDSFLKTMLRSGLLDRDQLQSLLRAVPSALRDDPEVLARHLVKQGILSTFQARKLLKGTALGLVLGPYHVLAPIGRGGMGTVYLARDSRSGELLALKVLPPKRARAEERLLLRFRREMELCQLVAHPHLARSYGVGVYKGVYYIAMEYIPGRSLHRLVSEQGQLPVPRAARLFMEVTAALDHAHGRGLIHRDLKPSNILVTPNDHAKVLDLGLAMMEGEDLNNNREVVGGRGYVVGTMDYLAPEQAEDAARVGPRSDIYGLGCTLFYTLTGQPPFPGGTTREKIRRHRSELPAWIPELNPTVPSAFASLVQKMMAKNPEQRFGSAAEVHRELKPWAEAEPALPVDQAGDTAYRHAIALLKTEETVEPDADLSAEVIATIASAPDNIPEVIPVGPGVPAPGRLRGWSWPLDLAQGLKLRSRNPQDLWTAAVLVGEVAALLFLGLVLVIMLYFLLR